MSKNFLSYVWQHSAPQQVLVLLLTVASFPILLITLELPKQIINNAIQGEEFPVTVFGFSFEQVGYLVALCLAYFAFVLAGGLLKMRTNTIKGVLGERLLRRFRFQLVRQITRFPLPYFRQTPQGSLISMVTAEAEAIGNMMGEAFARPTFAAGQMLTILFFFFKENFWLGLAACAMIPVQAYVVPKLQRKINLLNKQRILLVRRLSEQIGEAVHGAEDMRANAGARFMLALFSGRFGDIFTVRLEIYQRKFFMKFVNNTLNQITPFLLLLVGGYLIIQGDLNIGALTVALAYYKDLLGPWRELLGYYSQIQDVSLRYKTIAEQFEPSGMIDEELFFAKPDVIPALDGPVKLEDVTVADHFGAPVLTGMNVELPAGAFISIKSQNASARQAFARLLSRSVLPTSGSVSIGGENLNGLHQATIAARVGVVSVEPQFFHGTIQRNVQMALMTAPDPTYMPAPEEAERQAEARLVGNSEDIAQGPWSDTQLAGAKDQDELRDWWAHIIRQVGFEQFLMLRALNSQMNVDSNPRLAERLVALRPKVREKLAEEGLQDQIAVFDYEKFNPSLTLIENIQFAIRNKDVQTPGSRIDPKIWSVIEEMGVAKYHVEWSFQMLDTLVETFTDISPSHPLFQRLEILTPESFEELKTIHGKHRRGDKLSKDEMALVVTLPLGVPAEQLSSAFTDEVRTFLVEARDYSTKNLQSAFSAYYEAIDPEKYNSNMTVLENLIFGRISTHNQSENDRIRDVVSGILAEEGLARDVLLLIGDVKTGFSGSKLPQAAHDRIAFVRATIKRPRLLVLNRPFANSLPEIQKALHDNLRDLLPEATIIHLDTDFPENQIYDKHYEIVDSRLVDLDAETPTEAVAAEEAEPGVARTSSDDLHHKLRTLAAVDLLSGLDRQQLRLMAYGAQWFTAKKGDALFKTGERPDGAYLLTKGLAELQWERGDGERVTITEVPPGRMIGELSVLLDEARVMDMVVTEDAKGLIITGQVFNDVVENDAGVATSLLRTVTGHLLNTAQNLSDLHKEIGELKSGTGPDSKADDA